MPLTISTIGDMIDGNYSLAAHCYNNKCSHWAWLDLDMLAARLGRGHGSMHKDLVPKLRCSKCGSKDVGLRMSPPTGAPGRPAPGR